jgi:hypothetical protein
VFFSIRIEHLTNMIWWFKLIKIFEKHIIHGMCAHDQINDELELRHYKKGLYKLYNHSSSTIITQPVSKIFKWVNW